MQHTAFFGDGEKTFALTSEMIHELERTTGSGIMALHYRYREGVARFSDLTEVIRTGLIGGGMSPEESHKLISIYSRSMLITDLYHLAFDILDARYFGKPEAPAIPQDDLRQAAASGDMSAAVNDALKDTGL
jgi:hypothetical protein